MKRIQYIMFALFAFLLSACEEEVEYDAKALENFIVLNAKFVAGERPSCCISRSNTIYDDIKKGDLKTVYLPNALVSATMDGAVHPFSLITDSLGYMEIADAVAKEGETYTITARCDGLKPVSAKVTVPSKPKASFELAKKGEENEYFFDITVDDDGSTADYYQITASCLYEIPDIVGEERFQRDSINLSSSDPVLHWNKASSGEEFSDVIGGLYDNVFSLFNDEIFNGQATTFRVQVFTDLFSYYYNDRFYFREDMVLKEITFHIRHISTDTYLYYSTYNDISTGNESLSPNVLKCNVEGGAGIVEAWSEVKLVYQVEE